MNGLIFVLIGRIVRYISYGLIIFDGLSLIETKILLGLVALRYFFDRSRRGARLEGHPLAHQEGTWALLTGISDILIIILTTYTAFKVF